MEFKSSNPLPTKIMLCLYIQPKSSRDQWVGWYGEEYKLAITAPPVDGKANDHIIKLLSKTFKVAKKNIMIEQGELGRHKRISIQFPTLIPEELASVVKIIN
ncbi:DUF167 family protein [Thorsellia anophelis]|uniref:UPF0235 protein SAMN02583745_00194 n=1 Tax=Thorsellia anophelis DSM 18579 TaxID=1123402 RepID=A0A1H9YD52_9GAMM|nr:DUF167 family protein [Thorsellia anophelis]SES66899.1 hypothetical protein SAMN02583745_00194 [Thorsellia anophelis DSM 18579]